jgi:hypothetical protein
MLSSLLFASMVFSTLFTCFFSTTRYKSSDFPYFFHFDIPAFTSVSQLLMVVKVRLRYDCATIAPELRSDRKAVAQGLQGGCAVIAKRLRSVRKAIAQ